MRMTNLILVTTVLCLYGCATPIDVLDYYKTDSATLAKIRDMKVVGKNALSSGKYTDLGEVQGLYCNRARWDPSANTDFAETRAKDQLRIRAAAQGADYITKPQCTVNKGMDLTNNCWATLNCSSHALVETSP